jgi:hypothetical protein
MTYFTSTARASRWLAYSLAMGCIAPLPATPPEQASVSSAQKITPPKEALGFEVGADYQLASYDQLVAWWKKLATESDRMKLVDIGKTEFGRTQYMAIITSPANLSKLGRYKEISKKLALAEGLNDDEARALAREGKAVVWIDGGLHADEVVGSQQLLELVYQMVSRNDEETKRILDDVILLAVAANPDGMELVSNWYNREPDPTKRVPGNMPYLYNKYIGHDNNRDSYMSNMKETANLNRQLYIEWFPSIVYNTHQSGPPGTVMFTPPFRDPFNYRTDPLTLVELNLFGSAMHTRFVAEGKPGVTMRSGARFSSWYNGGLRTTTYFHNMIGILTETIGNPTPIDLPLIPQKQLAINDLPFPVAPQKWHFRQSIDYSMTADKAILSLASKLREDLLFNGYQMGRNSIKRGSEDSWTITPKRIEALKAATTKEAATKLAKEPGRDGRANRTTPPQPTSPLSPFSDWEESTTAANLYESTLHDPAMRDPRGYVIPSDQADFPTATKFINALLKNGVSVEKATTKFQVAGKTYPAGSWVVKTAQAFRPHVLDMFEPQDHPNDMQYPGGPPVPPYDVTGYTLAFQMGVKFDRIMDAFDGPFQKVAGLQNPPPGKISGPAHGAGFLVSHAVNDSFIITNRLLKNGDEVFWLSKPVVEGGKTLTAGTLFIPDRKDARAILEKSAAELGVDVQVVEQRPAGDALKLKPVRIGLMDQYGGSMTSGWLRWVLEQFEFPYKVVFPQEVDAGKLADKFDVLVFPDGALPHASGDHRAKGPGSNERAKGIRKPAGSRDA